MKVSSLLERLEHEILAGSADAEVTGLSYDNRKVGAGDIFVCIKGANFDAHTKAAEIAGAGAAAIVVSKEAVSEGIVKPAECGNATVIVVDDTRKALSYISAAYFGYPAEKLVTIGVTGTKGKTSTTYMIKDILERTGTPTGLIGTIETVIGEESFANSNTTPESYAIQKDFYKMVQAGLKAVVMEVSSQGLMMDRVAGINYDYAIFTNISPDHIGPNEHKDFDDYMHWKAQLFRQCKHGIFNLDDPHTKDVIAQATCDVETYGIDNDEADYNATDIKLLHENGKLATDYHVSGKVEMDVETDVPGRFSVYNSLAALVVCVHFTKDRESINKALGEVAVKGRVEPVETGRPYSVLIDYAHNAVALESLLETLREYHPRRIVTLFGCGGNRDRNRRFEMGEVSSRLSDLTVVTSDNPRFEEPEAIVDDIITGVKKADGEYVRIVDRREAIKYVLENGREGDVIVLAGKGHEDYQEIKGVKHHMDEREIIADILKELDGK